MEPDVSISASVPLWLRLLGALLIAGVGLAAISLAIRRGRESGKPRLTDTASYSRRQRRVPALLAGLALLAVFALFLDVDQHGLITNTFDAGVHEWFVRNRASWLTPVVIAVTNTFSPVGTTVIGFVVATIFAVRTRSWVPAAVIFIGPAVTGLGVRLLKYAVPRNRPNVAEQLVRTLDPSFPSGHVTGAVSLLGCICVVLFAGFTADLGRPAKVGIGIAAALVSALVALTRLYLGVHWFTDVVAGGLLGASGVAGTLAFYRAAQMRTGRPGALGASAPAP
ncbi:phosphatase PAP2 family protein [Nakamurella antarctica]|uniref:phosphatase PAP2 family protein n=1 Tax=Nakamurella antarctica TaxID=1902245 RepID=UPI0013DD9FC2|nr:phosphatase PAP2 family protein [Nakamurella antarctica]